MSRNIMSIGRIMYSKIPTKRKLSDFYGFGLPSITIKDIFGRKVNIEDAVIKNTFRVLSDSHHQYVFKYKISGIYICSRRKLSNK